MASLVPPPALKGMAPYMAQAAALEKHNSAIAFFLRSYAAELGVQVLRAKSQDPAVRPYMFQLLDKLEADKRQLQMSSDDGKALVDQFANTLFEQANDEFNNGRASKSTSVRFYTAALLYNSKKQFGPLTEDDEVRSQYATARAVEIKQGIRNGTIVAGAADDDAFAVAAAATSALAPAAPAPQPLQPPAPQPLQPSQPSPRMVPAAAPPAASYPAAPDAAALAPSFAPTPYGGAPVPAPAAAPAHGAVPSYASYPAQATPPMYTAPPGFPSAAPLAPVAPRPAVAPSAPSPTAAAAAAPAAPAPAAHSGSSFKPQSHGLHLPVGAGGVTFDSICEAQKYTKYAVSALQFQDVGTAVQNLERALSLLRPH